MAPQGQHLPQLPTAGDASLHTQAVLYSSFGAKVTQNVHEVFSAGFAYVEKPDIPIFASI